MINEGAGARRLPAQHHLFAGIDQRQFGAAERAGGGMEVGLSESWSWILEANLLAGASDFSMVVDLNTGLRVRL